MLESTPVSGDSSSCQILYGNLCFQSLPANAKLSICLYLRDRRYIPLRRIPYETGTSVRDYRWLDLSQEVKEGYEMRIKFRRRCHFWLAYGHRSVIFLPGKKNGGDGKSQ